MGNEIQETKYSVLMAVYIKEKPEFFKQALESIFSQTSTPDEVVIICDGPLTDGLNQVISDAYATHSNLLNVVRLEENKGLGNALMIGLPLCKNEFVMRADSDDICLPERAATQLNMMLEGGYDICSTTVSTFFESPDKIEGERRLPSEHNDIVAFAKTRSPFNHPSVMMRKSKALEAGNYRTLLYREDYYLWVKMILAGCRCHNIEEPLVLMRMDRNSYRRRKSKEAYKSQKFLSKYMRKNGFLSFFAYMKIRFLYWVQYIMPSSFNEWIYQKVLQRKR